MSKEFGKLYAAYGGEKWIPRIKSHREEIGQLWEFCGVDSEYAPLKSVLLHAPGPEWTEINDPKALQMMDCPELDLALKQHKAISQAYREAGVDVHYVKPDCVPPPNLVFCADLFFMTPEGAILARPASMIRAGEERWVARRLADLGVPILRTLTGEANFEGADAQWITRDMILLGRGLRTNTEGIFQVSETLESINIKTVAVDLPVGTMHLMGMLRFLDRDLAIAWPGRLSFYALQILRKNGYKVVFLPDEGEALNHSLNFVTLAPRKILMSSGNPITQQYLESLGVNCITAKTFELNKAAGGIGCLTGVIKREFI